MVVGELVAGEVVVWPVVGWAQIQFEGILCVSIFWLGMCAICGRIGLGLNVTVMLIVRI